MQDAGTAMGRIFGGIKGALGNLQHTPHIGPKALNGGEVIIAAGMYFQDIKFIFLEADIIKMVSVSICTACRTQLITPTLLNWLA